MKFSETDEGRKLVIRNGHVAGGNYCDHFEMIDKAFEAGVLKGEGCHDASQNCACYQEGRLEAEEPLNKVIESAKKEERARLKAEIEKKLKERIEYITVIYTGLERENAIILVKLIEEEIAEVFK